MSDNFIEALYAGDTAANKVLQAHTEINNVLSKLENALSTYLKVSVSLVCDPPRSASLKQILNAFSPSKDNSIDMNDIFDEVRAIEPSTKLKCEPLFFLKKTSNGWPIHIKHKSNTIKIASASEFEFVLNDILREPSTIFKLRDFITEIANANANADADADADVDVAGILVGHENINNNGDELSQTE